MEDKQLNPFEPRVEGESIESTVGKEWYMSTNTEDIEGVKTITLTPPPRYEINVDGIKDLDDVKTILRGLNLYIEPTAVDSFPKHLVRKVEK